MTLGVILLWIAGALLMAGLIELWCYCDRTGKPWIAPSVLVPRSTLRLLYASRISSGARSGALGARTSYQRSNVSTADTQSSPARAVISTVPRVVKWLFRTAGREVTDPVVEHLLAEHQRIHRREARRSTGRWRLIPNDPALLGRIQKLTAEVNSTDRAVLRRLNQPAAQAFGTEETPPQLRPLSCSATTVRRCTRLVRVGVLLLVVTGIVHFVAVALTQGRHHASAVDRRKPRSACLGHPATPESKSWRWSNTRSPKRASSTQPRSRLRAAKARTQ